LVAVVAPFEVGFTSVGVVSATVAGKSAKDFAIVFLRLAVFSALTSFINVRFQVINYSRCSISNNGTTSMLLEFVRPLSKQKAFRFRKK
jgi:hypothetical protein